MRGTAAWLAGLVPAARGIRALGAGAATANVLGGAASSFFTQAADAPGLSNLIQQYPALANPVTEFLASKPGDNAALNRLKHAAEGLGLGALAEGFAKALVLVQAARSVGGGDAGAAANAADVAAPATPAANPTVALDAPAPDAGAGPGTPNTPEAVPSPQTAQSPPSESLEEVGSASTAPQNADVEAHGEPFTLVTAPNAPDIAAPAAVQDAPNPASSDIAAIQLGEGDARYVVRSGQKFVALQNGTDDLGQITPDISKAIRREGGPIRLPEGKPGSRARGGFGEKQIESKSGADIRAYGYSDAASFASDIASNYRQIFEGEAGQLYLVKPNGGSKVAVIKLKPTGEGQDGSYWEIQSATIERPDYMKGKKLLWESPASGDAAPSAGQGPSVPAGNTPTALAPVLAIDDAAKSAVKEQLRSSYLSATKDVPRSDAPITIGPVTPEGAQRINTILHQAGVPGDVSGYTHEVDAYAARHVVNEHGSSATEKLRGQKEVTAEDWAMIPDVLQAPDRVRWVDDTDTGLPGIGYLKRINGHVLYVETVRTGRKTLSAQTMRKFVGPLD